MAQARAEAERENRINPVLQPVVLNDVAERFITLETARETYGVAITGSVDDDNLAVDESATATLRASMSGGGAVARPL